MGCIVIVSPTNSDIGKTQTDKRTKLVETAMKLAYRDGFRESSLADIAKAAHVPVGNVYYYFKTKEELGEAVVGAAPGGGSSISRRKWARLSSPKERLVAFVDNIQRNKEQFARAGCPFGGPMRRVA